MAKIRNICLPPKKKLIFLLPTKVDWVLERLMRVTFVTNDSAFFPNNYDYGQQRGKIRT